MIRALKGGLSLMSFKGEPRSRAREMDLKPDPQTGGVSLTIEPDWLAISCISVFSAALGLFLLF